MYLSSKPIVHCVVFSRDEETDASYFLAGYQIPVVGCLKKIAASEILTLRSWRA
jgi:hypothetical protein